MAAMRARIEGTVDLEGIVTTAGVLSDITVVRSLDAVNGLDQEAIRTAQLWRFTPGLRNGAPVNVRVTIEMAFTMTLRAVDDPIRVSYRLDEGVAAPEIIRRTPPHVTGALEASGFQGVLEVDGTVQVDGAVKISAVRIIAFRDGSPDSRSLAEDEVRRAIGDWKLTPAKKNGAPVPQPIKVIVHLPPD
jgi:TonB family protein